LGNLIVKIEDAASAVITRLADRAAYAHGNEYQEIRGLITGLRGLIGSGRAARG
jgi:hypothetical protein